MIDSNSSAAHFLAGIQIESQLDQIFQQLQRFHPEIIIKEQVGEANYFGSSHLRSARFLAEYHGQKAHLKIRGDHPMPSEAQQLTQLPKHNRSKLVMAPQLLLAIEWDNNLWFEGTLTKFVEGKSVIEHALAVEQFQVNAFFELYREYRSQLASQSWLTFPRVPLSKYLADKFSSLFQVAKTIQPNHKQRKKTDLALIKDGLDLIISYYQQFDDKAYVFGHGHFSLQDMLMSNDSKLYLFSPTAWRWQAPFADAVFAFHWYMISLANASQLLAVEIESMATMWQDSIYALALEPSLLPGFHQFSDSQRLIWIKLALLERYMAGLLIDLFAYADESMPHTKTLSHWFRQQLEQLMAELSAPS